MEQELKPCPLCGGPAIYRDFPDVKHVSHYVECATSCDLTLCAGNNKAEAITAWNTRTPDPEARALLEEQSDAIMEMARTATALINATERAGANTERRNVLECMRGIKDRRTIARSRAYLTRTDGGE